MTKFGAAEMRTNDAKHGSCAVDDCPNNAALGWFFCEGHIAEYGLKKLTDEERGLYRKYAIDRTDGSSRPGGKHECCDYFVLDLTHDQYAPNALRAYASACADDYPQLASDLRRRSVGEKSDELSRGQRVDKASVADEAKRLHNAHWNGAITMAGLIVRDALAARGLAESNEEIQKLLAAERVDPLAERDKDYKDGYAAGLAVPCNECDGVRTDYPQAPADVERAAIVAYVRKCAANNGALVTSSNPDVRWRADRDARMFAFIADSIDRGEHRPDLAKVPRG